MASDGIILCPFFEKQSQGVKSNRHFIQCEQYEVVEGYHIRIQYIFTTKEKKNHYGLRFCANQYNECPHYRMLMKTKYKDC